jgi:predicted Ser/Thr protein kinase
MGAITQLVGGVLSWLHSSFATNTCPGGWLWTAVFAGAVLALLPWLGMLLGFVVLKVVGRRGSVGPGALFAVTAVSGVLFALVLPMSFTSAVSSVFQRAVLRENNGLSDNDLVTLGTPTCTGTQTQLAYLGSGPTTAQAIGHPAAHSATYVLYLGLLVGLPLVGLILVWTYGRVALRGSPLWAPALFAVPFVGFLVSTTSMSGNVLAQMWLGFIPVSVIGALLFILFPPPSFASADRPMWTDYPPADYSEYQPAPQPAPQRPPQRSPQWSTQRPPYLPELPPTGQTNRAPMPGAPVPLAASPGPLPFAGEAVSRAGGRFQRIRQLGQGGFGTVWLAQDTQLGRTVALKLAHAPDAETEQRMLREARALAAVHHPNCVRIYDVVQDVDGLAIVMQYIEGNPLGDTVRGNGPLGDVSAARLWLTMAGALAAAHDKGVLHRDVKPSNILLDPEAIPHLLDFGIARTSGDATLTATGMMIGTPDYLAPETARTGVSSTASDAWQLAATVSFALTGKPPRGIKDNAMAALAAASQAQPCSELPTNSAHRALLVSALDPDPSARPPLASVQRTLGEWLAGGGHSAEGPVTAIIDGRGEATRPMR